MGEAGIEERASPTTASEEELSSWAELGETRTRERASRVGIKFKVIFKSFRVRGGKIRKVAVHC